MNDSFVATPSPEPTLVPPERGMDVDMLAIVFAACAICALVVFLIFRDRRVG